MPKPLAVILGAGPVGLSVGKILLQREHTVRFITRKGTRVPLEGTETRAADIRNPEALITAAQGARILVHAAGVPYQDWAREFPPMQTAILTAARSIGAVVVFAENLYSYDPRIMPLNELSAEIPPTKKGALRQALSRQWLEAHREGLVKAVSVRASDYFGPGATRSPNSHFGARFFPGLEAGKSVSFLGNPDALHSFTYLKDYARALADAALTPEAWGRVWICPAMAPATPRTVAELFAAEAGRTIKVGSLPSYLVRMLGLFDPLVREVVEMLYQFEKDFTVDASEFEARFGWKAADLKTAVKETWADHLAAVR